MDRANYFNGQRVTLDDLNYTETSKALAMQKILAGLSGKEPKVITGSIPVNFQRTSGDTIPNAITMRGVLGGIGSNHLTPLNLSATQISIQRGWAVTDGMDLIILTSTATINQGDNSFNSRWTEVSNNTMYVVAEYQEASSSVGTDPSGNIYYTRYTPSYRINVTAAQPTGSAQVFLAQFTGNAGAITPGTFIICLYSKS